MPLPIIFFNAAGFIVSVAAIIMIARASMVLSKAYRTNVLFILKALLFVSMSFLFSLFLGQFLGVTKILTAQSIILALGVSVLVYSANKLFEMYERSKIIGEVEKEVQRRSAGIIERTLPKEKEVDVADIIDVVGDAIRVDFDEANNK